MKYSILSIALLLTVFTSCKDAPEADETEANAPQNVEMTTGADYNVKTDQSKITWVGTKATGRHEGTILLKSGKLMVSNAQVTGGVFVADMTTITPHDQDEEGNAKLQKHLKSEDFFDVAKHPDGTFEITAVAPLTTITNDDVKLANATHNVTGNLTLKGISKSITFPARIAVTANEITADADFNIDRGEWNVNYGNDKSLGNKYINPEINIKLNLVAAK